MKNNPVKKWFLESGTKQTVIAPKLHITSQSLSSALNKGSFNTDFLLRLSVATKHNFFEDYAKICNDQLNGIEEEQPKRKGATPLEDMVIDIVQKELKKKR